MYRVGCKLLKVHPRNIDILNLDGESSGVVYNPLSDPSDRLRRSGGSVAENSKGRLVNRGLANPIYSSKTSLVQLFPLNYNWTDGQIFANLPDKLEHGNIVAEYRHLSALRVSQKDLRQGRRQYASRCKGCRQSWRTSEFP